MVLKSALGKRSLRAKSLRTAALQHPKKYYSPYFTKEETEAQRSQVPRPRPGKLVSAKTGVRSVHSNPIKWTYDYPHPKSRTVRNREGH